LFPAFAVHFPEVLAQDVVTQHFPFMTVEEDGEVRIMNKQVGV
jgi:hypothetical protein